MGWIRMCSSSLGGEMVSNAKFEHFLRKQLSCLVVALGHDMLVRPRAVLMTTLARACCFISEEQ